jgi:hypothetical protein
MLTGWSGRIDERIWAGHLVFFLAIRRRRKRKMRGRELSVITYLYLQME